MNLRSTTNRFILLAVVCLQAHVTNSPQHQPAAIVSDSDQALKRTRNVDLDGNDR
ncbi:hypothetical protein Mal15_23820 [Stieleria maiorica]|uniref:Uncharacterized protein n=1 Tax=Stieleria maiorica TaxID=2795974 RepID=A0A5B9MEC8_9BACT|nr:hypothetical protein [Stieleria maiorica]QEF98330.1 hypothetical protein Mal15_23820 [Stieleria maiorica]